jgi:hypothetical protein
MHDTHPIASHELAPRFPVVQMLLQSPKAALHKRHVKTATAKSSCLRCTLLELLRAMCRLDWNEAPLQYFHHNE